MLVPLLFAVQGAALAAECPAHDVVEARVRSILHLAAEQTLTETFAVERRASSLFVELRGEGSALIGQRELPLEGSCDELAQAAAVVLSAWLTDVHPDFAGALPEPTAEPEPEPTAEPEPKIEPPPVVAKPQAVGSIDGEREPQATEPPPRKPSKPRALQLGIVAGGDLTSSQLAAAGGALIDFGFVERGFGLVAMALVTTVRSDSLGPGSVEWRRWPLALGPRYRFGVKSLALDLSAGPVAGWLHLAGVGFDANAEQSGVSWGAFASTRLSLSRGAGPFAVLSGQVFPGESTAFVAGLAPEWPLPTLTVALLLGFQIAP